MRNTLLIFRKPERKRPPEKPKLVWEMYVCGRDTADPGLNPVAHCCNERNGEFIDQLGDNFQLSKGSCPVELDKDANQKTEAMNMFFLALFIYFLF
jgi:hypothetical protein